MMNGVADVLSTIIRKMRTARLKRAVADDSGLAAVLLVSVIAIVAFTALSIFLNKYIGDRTFERERGTAAGQTRVTSALTAYFLSNGGSSPTYKMVCPDTDYNGTANSPCETTGTVYKGVIPWVDVGLSRDEVVDSYGNFYTYLVSGTANGGSSTARGICDAVTSDFDGLSEFTGEMLASSIELINTTQTPGQTPTQGRNVPYVVISHGENGLGARSSTGVARGAATATYEVANAGATPTTIYTGPPNNGSVSAATYLDDVVYAPSKEELESTCERLMPGGGLNTDVKEGFDSDTSAAATFGTIADGGVQIVTKGTNRVARFTGTGTPGTLTTQASFNPSVRPIYTSLKWTPNPTFVSGTPATHATISGLSVATRNTSTDRAGTAFFDRYNAGSFRGITFRFFNGALGTSISQAGVANTISIFEYSDATTENSIGTSATTFSLRSNATYIVEVYDDGINVWARITEDGNTTNTAEVRGTTNADHTGSQGVSYISQSDVTPLADVDDVALGLPMLALETSGTSSALYAAAGNNNGPTDGNLSVEAWVRPRGLPTGTNIGVVVGQWDTSTTGTSSYRVFLDSDGELNLQVAGSIGGSPGTETFAMGISPELNEWTHIALTFDATSKAVQFYKFGTLVRTGTSTTSSGSGIRNGAVAFGIGADFNASTAAPVDGYNGNVSDVRVWSDVRTSAEILRYYKRRLVSAIGAAAPVTDTAEVAALRVNWKLDSESGDVNDATPAAIATPPLYGSDSSGAVGARYVPALAVYVRPNSREVCPSGTRARLYQCDVRTSAAAGVTQAVTIPSRLPTLFAKVWGAGGGGYDPGGASDDTAGGSSGFSAGLIRTINGTAIAGQVLNVYAGGYGAGSSSENTGGGGGGGSGVYLSTSLGVVAGGGGGASFSDDTANNDCTSVFDTTARCGLGGNGGGSGALTVRPPDAISEPNGCAGRGGDNVGADNGPPDASNCENGGGDPFGRQGGGETTGGGGGPSFIAGGAAYTGLNNRVGGGGGGGGAIGGESGGYDDDNSTRGYGGGGGSGALDTLSGVSNTSGEAGNYSLVTTVDSSRTGNIATSPPGQANRVTNISPALTGTWFVGDSISGTGIPSGTTITQIHPSNTQVTMSQNATMTLTGVMLTVTPANASPKSTPGGMTDPYYSPTYLGTTLQNPGVGGTTGANVNGRGGAVVLIW